jgi:hypothetical protein
MNISVPVDSTTCTCSRLNMSTNGVLDIFPADLTTNSAAYMNFKNNAIINGISIRSYLLSKINVNR